MLVYLALWHTPSTSRTRCPHSNKSNKHACKILLRMRFFFFLERWTYFSLTAKLPGHNNLQEPLPLVRAASRCYAPCDTVSWLSRKVKQLGDQLRTTQAALKKLMDNPVLKGEGKLLYFYDCFVFLSMGINQERNLKIFMVQKLLQLIVQWQ